MTFFETQCRFSSRATAPPPTPPAAAFSIFSSFIFHCIQLRNMPSNFCPSVCPSICLSQSWAVSKLFSISSRRSAITFYLTPGMGAKYCNQRARMSVCLFSRISQKPHIHISLNCLCMLAALAVVRSYSDDHATHYILPFFISIYCATALA